MSNQLRAVGGHLYLRDEDGKDQILIRRYNAGDCDTISWPDPDLKNLASALYDAFEKGQIKTRLLFLPNGDTFNIDENLKDDDGDWEQEVRMQNMMMYGAEAGD